MKKGKTKKLLALLLSLVMLMSFAACGDGASEQTKKDEVANSGGNGFNDGEMNSNTSNNEYKVGDYITFGKYEQDNDTSNGAEDIEWLVLDVKDDKVLVISKYQLECKLYNEERVNVTWEDCTLREWLNIDFINSAFNSTEKASIPTVTVPADKNPSYDTNSGSATQDKVFLLSANEANRYFASNVARKCGPTEYALANGADVNSNNGNCWWWLRTAGEYQNNAACVDTVGDVLDYGTCVDIDDIAVRPAMWITIG